MVFRSSLHNSFRGFTLVELMVTIVVMATLAAIAVPSFQKALSSQRMNTATRELVSTFAAARSQSVLLNRKVDVTFTLTPDSNNQISWLASATGLSFKPIVLPKDIMVSLDPSTVTVIHFFPSGVITTDDASVDGAAGVYFGVCDNSSYITGEVKRVVFLSGFGAAREQRTLRNNAGATCS